MFSWDHSLNLQAVTQAVVWVVACATERESYCKRVHPLPPTSHCLVADWRPLSSPPRQIQLDSSVMRRRVERCSLSQTLRRHAPKPPHQSLKQKVAGIGEQALAHLCCTKGHCMQTRLPYLLHQACEGILATL